MRSALAVGTAFVVLVVCGLVHGLWTDRWALAKEPGASAAKVANVPLKIGDWEGQDQEINPRDLEKAEAVGWLWRTYVHRRTGNAVSILLLCGRSGPIAVHPPDVCYRGAGYEPVSVVRHQLPVESSSSPPEFMVGHFQKQEAAVLQHLRILWAWSATGPWMAPEHPRWTFARHPALFKLYVLRQLPRGDEKLEDDPVVEFIRLLVPELQKALFSDA